MEKQKRVKVTGPLGEPVICEYGIIESTKTAVIEMAGAAGITQVPDEKEILFILQPTASVR